MPENPGDLLSELVDELDCPYGVERSVKFRRFRLFSDRLLLTIHKAAFGTEPVCNLRNMLAKTGFPEYGYEGLLVHLDAADIIHFGYEGHDRGYIYKCYLEFAERYSKSWGNEVPDKLLVYTAFKWDPAPNGMIRTSYYHSYPATTVKEVEKFLLDVYGSDSQSAACAVTRELLSTDAMTKLDGDLMVLAVTEEDNKRSSFDLNLYDTGMKLSFIENQLDQVAEYFNIEHTVWQKYFNEVRDNSLGHLAGGMDSTGNEFYTVYFGVEERIPV